MDASLRHHRRCTTNPTPQHSRILHALHALTISTRHASTKSPSKDLPHQRKKPGVPKPASSKQPTSSNSSSTTPAKRHLPTTRAQPSTPLPTRTSAPSYPTRPRQTQPQNLSIPLPSTTIALPSSPKPAPSPITPPPAGHPSSSHNPTSTQHQHQHRLPNPSYHHHRPAGRLIEPVADTKLPAKYKPAARRLTAIVVGIPVVLVVGWELFERWRGKEVKRVFRDERVV